MDEKYRETLMSIQTNLRHSIELLEKDRQKEQKRDRFIQLISASLTGLRSCNPRCSDTGYTDKRLRQWSSNEFATASIADAKAVMAQLEKE